MPATSDAKRAPAPKSGAKPVSGTARARRRGPVPIADAYLSRAVIESSLRGLCWFAGLFLAFAIVTGSRRVAQDGMPMSLALEMIALQMPRIVLFTIPASLLYGTLSTFNELSSRGEVTAFMAGGMSLWRMLRGPLVFGVLMGIFAFWLQEIVVPGSESRKDDIVKSVGSRIGTQKNFKVVDSNSDGSIKLVLQAQALNPSDLSLEKPVVQIYGKDNTIDKEITAESGRWDRESRSWMLFKGAVRSKPKPGNSQIYSFQVPFESTRLETSKSLLPANLTSDKLTTSDRLKKQNYEMVSMRDLKEYRAELLAEFGKAKGTVRSDLRKTIRGLTFGIHDKFATPLVCLAMIMVGAPLGIRPQRSASAGLAMGLSLGFLIFYYIIWTLATSWAKGGGAAPEVAAYLAFLVTMGIGTILVKRKS